MPIDSEIIVVSGLPRSGTSLMMQMLDRGGIPALTDASRAADEDNPRGYYELERVKQTKRDGSWLPDARGKVVKMVSSLLYELPDTETYRIVFMSRDLDEVLASQAKMLKRLDRPAAGSFEEMKSAFTLHLERVLEWLPQQRHMSVLHVSYNRLLSDPQPELGAIAEFLEGRPAAERMLEAIDRSLYRNRGPATGADRE